MAKIEKEYANNRGGPAGEGADAWKGGNLNFELEATDDDDEEEEEEDEESGGVTLPDPLAPLLPDSSDGDGEEEKEEEEQMAEIRRRVLASKPFTNPTPSASDSPPAHIKIISRPVAASSPAYDDPNEDSSQPDEDDDDGGGGEEDNELFDQIIDARPPPNDRTRIKKILARKPDESFPYARRNRYVSV